MKTILVGVSISLIGGGHLGFKMASSDIYIIDISDILHDPKLIFDTLVKHDDLYTTI